MKISYELPHTDAPIPVSFEIPPRVAKIASALPQDRRPTEQEIFNLPLSDHRATAHVLFATMHEPTIQASLTEMRATAANPVAMEVLQPEQRGLVRAAAELIHVIAVEHHRQPYYLVHGAKGNSWQAFTPQTVVRGR